MMVTISGTHQPAISFENANLIGERYLFIEVCDPDPGLHQDQADNEGYVVIVRELPKLQPFFVILVH